MPQTIFIFQLPPSFASFHIDWDGGYYKHRSKKAKALVFVFEISKKNLSFQKLRESEKAQDAQKHK